MNAFDASSEKSLGTPSDHEEHAVPAVLGLAIIHKEYLNVVLDEDEKALHDLWEATSFELDKLQSNPACAEQEQEGLKKRHKPAWKLTYEPRATPAEWLASASKYRVAIIREEGSNGDREMAAAMYAAGFEPWDVHVRDLLSGRITLEGFRGIVFVGGFSDADVLESVRGWRIKRTAAFSHSMIP